MATLQSFLNLIRNNLNFLEKTAKMEATKFQHEIALPLHLIIQSTVDNKNHSWLYRFMWTSSFF